jgi:predicted nucleic acid-binding protein
MNLFIDTNIFLSFYHLTSEDLEELRKLGVLLEQQQVKLYLTDQVVTEFRRNREVKIADALKRLSEQRLNLQFPQLCKDYCEYDQLRSLQRAYEELHSVLLKKILEDVSEQTLKADKTIEDLFAKATLANTTAELVEKARLRMQVGNPPGKDGSLGDAISWEALLRDVQDSNDLYLIADDRDYVSTLDENKIKDFLLQEWFARKGSKIIFYRRLSSFFKDRFPQIRLATELEKEILIRNLAASGSFAQTHSVVAKLSKFTDFTTAQLNEIVEAAVFNRQVSWIIGDPDVYEFLKSVTAGHEADIKEDNWKELQGLMKKAEMEMKEDAVEPLF